MGPPEYDTHQDEIRSTVASTVGGVVTTEVGAITGELEVATHPIVGDGEVMLRYAGANEWYTVEASPIAVDGPGGLSESELRELLHQRVVRYLTSSGPIVVDGNEQATSLLGFSLIAGDR